MPAQQKPPPGICFIEDYCDESGKVVVPGIASRVGVTPGTFRKWRMARKGPNCFMLGKRVAAREEVVDAWVAEQEEAARRLAEEVPDEMRPPEPRLYRPKPKLPRKQLAPIAA